MEQKAAIRKVGLARALSKLGHCSRSQAFNLIRVGRVKLNGRTIRDAEFPVNLLKDRIEVNGERLVTAEKIILMMNKPRGIVTTASDEQGRGIVYSLLPNGLPYLAPVGRLDKASEGLLLMTNDSEWAARITDPTSHLDKTYHVQVSVIPDEEMFRKMKKGTKVKDGETLKLKRVHEIRRGDKNSWLEVVLDEGKNRHIRRMMEALNVKVFRLVRVAIGLLELGELAKGAYRMLTSAEKEMLDEAMLQRKEPHKS